MARKLLLDPYSDALLLVDVQKAFMTGGGLAVADAEAIVPVILRLRPHFDLIWASIDRHPPGHISLVSSYVGYEPFHPLTLEEVEGWDEADDRLESAEFTLDQLKAYLRETGVQVLWPDHAVELTGEDQLAEEIADIPRTNLLVKGMDPACDSYSVFKDNLGRPTGLADVLRSKGVKRVFLCGLAEDFCVGWSALDAATEGFETYIVRDATRPVDTPPSGDDPGSLATIRRRFKEAGVNYVDAARLSSY